MSERKCIVTGTISDPDALIRFVRAPMDGEVIPDFRQELPGRGVWIGNSRELVQAAVDRKLFARGFRQPCNISADLADRVGKGLDNRALNYLSLARKAGQAVHGFEKVDSLIMSGGIAVLISACDGAEDGKGKLRQHLRSNGLDVPIVELFASEQLGLALGRTNVIHAALADGGLAGRFVAAAHRARQYRGSADGIATEFRKTE